MSHIAGVDYKILTTRQYGFICTGKSVRFGLVQAGRDAIECSPYESPICPDCLSCRTSGDDWPPGSCRSSGSSNRSVCGVGPADDVAGYSSGCGRYCAGCSFGCVDLWLYVRDGGDRRSPNLPAVARSPRAVSLYYTCDGGTGRYTNPEGSQTGDPDTLSDVGQFRNGPVLCLRGARSGGHWWVWSCQ